MNFHRTLLNTLFAAAPLVGFAPASLAQQAFDDPTPVVGPYRPKIGELDVSLRMPGYDSIEFRAEAVPFPGQPRSLWIPTSPLGYGAVLADDTMADGDCFLYFEQLGALVPMSWSGPFSVWDGVYGSLSATLRQAPSIQLGGGDSLSQGPQDPPNISIREVVAPGGVEGIVIGIQGTQEATYGFIQFVTVSVFWTGSSCGVPTEGIGAGPMTSGANGGRPMETDGTRTYVDATNLAGGGEYPHQGSGPVPGTGNPPTPPETLNEMGDMPNLKDGDALVDGIVAGNGCLSVNTVTLVQHFTAYAWVQPTGQPRRFVAKIEWSFEETVTIGDGPSPGNADGDFGGPGAGPTAPGSIFTNGVPTVTPVTGLDSNHAAALNGFPTSGAGAPSGSW